MHRYLDRELRRNLYDDLESDLLGEREPLEHLLGEPLREPLLPRLGEPLSDPLDPLLGEPLKELLGGEILLLPPLCKLVLSCSSLLALPTHPSNPFWQMAPGTETCVDPSPERPPSIYCNATQAQASVSAI